jgi:hypothetical protein
MTATHSPQPNGIDGGVKENLPIYRDRSVVYNHIVRELKTHSYIKITVEEFRTLLTEEERKLISDTYSLYILLSKNKLYITTWK